MNRSTFAQRVRALTAAHPVTNYLIAFSVGLVLAGGILGIVAGSQAGRAGDAEAERDGLSASLTSAESERDAAQDAADAITERRDKLLTDARSRANAIISDARGELVATKSKLASVEDKLGGTQAELDDVRSSLEGAQREKALSSFGDGIWQADVDFLPGTYRSSGGPGCYYAMLNSADTGDIESNNFSGDGGQQLATIYSAYFETEDCGKWKRVGD